MYCIIFGNTFVNLSGNPYPAPSPFCFAKVGLFEPYAVSEPSSLNNKLKFFAEISRKFQRVLKWDGYTLMLQMNSGTQNLSSPLSPEGYSHTLPIGVCAAQRGRDFEAPGLERGIHFRGVF